MASSGDCQKAKDDLQLAQERFGHESEQLTNSHQQKLEALQMEIRQLVRMGDGGGGRARTHIQTYTAHTHT